MSIMSTNNTKYIILLSCGSFNPPTFMHLRMFEIAKDNLNSRGYHVIDGIMSPVHDGYGKKELANASHRCAMVKKALSCSSWIRLSDWECKQENWAPTRQVLQFHQNILNSLLTDHNHTLAASPEKRQRREDLSWLSDEMQSRGREARVEVKLLCGADLLESFGTPGVWNNEDLTSIVGDHGLVVITREGSSPCKFIYESDLLTKYQNNIYLVTEWIANEVSSTKIRRAVRRGESIKYLLPEPVMSYIIQYGLYGRQDNKYDISPGYSGQSQSLFPTPSPSDNNMSISPGSPYHELQNTRSCCSSVSSGGFLAIPTPCPPLGGRGGGGTRHQRPPTLLIEDVGQKQQQQPVVHKKNLLVTFPGQAVQVLEVRPQVEGANAEQEGGEGVEEGEEGEPCSESSQASATSAHITMHVQCVEEETKVLFQITKNGVTVISDKETAV